MATEAEWRSSIDQIKSDFDAGVKTESRARKLFDSMRAALMGDPTVDPATKASVADRIEEHLEAIDATTAVTSETVVDPTDLWSTFVRKNFPAALSAPDSRGESHAEQVRILKIILQQCIDYAAEYLWANPLATKLVENEANFSHIPITTKTQKLAYNDLFNKIPDAELQKEFKDQIEFLYEILKHASEWSEVIASGGSFEAFGEFLKKSIFDGSQWKLLQHLPSLNRREQLGIGVGLTSPEPGLGHQVFYGLNYYNNWNNYYVYATEDEFRAVELDFENLLSRRELKIPSPQDLLDIRKIHDNEQLKERWGKLLPSWLFTEGEIPEPALGDADVVKRITLGDLRQLMQEAGSDQLSPTDPNELNKDPQLIYNNFVKRFKELVLRKMTASRVEAPKQRDFGLFPLVEFGNANPEKTKRFREEVAVAIGCFTLGLGNYSPRINPRDVHAGMLSDTATGTERPLLPAERSAAIVAGKSAELLAFDSYICNCNHWFDDDVTMKAALTGNRACITEAYRSQYVNSRATLDGMYRFGVRFVVSMFPRPLSYLSANGDRLKAIFEDPTQFEHTDFEAIGDRNSKFIKNMFDIWGYVVDMYKPLTVGVSSTIGTNILDIAKVTQPKTIFNAARDLEFNYKAIDALTNFYSKVISYWTDRLTCTGTEKNDPNHPKYGADEVYWQRVQSPIDPTKQLEVYTPLMHMLNFTPQELHELVTSILRSTTRAGVVSADRQRSAFNEKISKTLLRIAMVEDMLRSTKKTVDLDDLAALNMVLTSDERYTHWVRRRYNLKGAGKFTTDTGDTIKFTPEEVAQMVIDADLTTPAIIASLLSEAGGLPGS